MIQNNIKLYSLFQGTKKYFLRTQIRKNKKFKFENFGSPLIGLFERFNVYSIIVFTSSFTGVGCVI
jgi:hypothetical protein